MHHYYKPFLIDISDNPTAGASEAFNLGAEPEPTAPLSILCPANLQSVDQVKFQVSRDNSTYYDILANGVVATIPVVANSVIPVPSEIARACLGWEWIRLLTTDGADTAEEPGADITFIVAFASSVPEGAGLIQAGGTAGPLRELSFQITCAAAGDYAAGDVLSASATNNAGAATAIANAVRDGLGLTIMAARAVCSEDSVLFRMRLHFFDSAPATSEVEMDDNAAFSFLTAAGAAKWIGSVDLPAFADRGAVAVAEDDQLRKALYLASPTLYVVAETLDADTNETASMTIDVTLVVI